MSDVFSIQIHNLPGWGFRLLGSLPNPLEKKGVKATGKEKIQMENGVLLIDTRRAC